MTSLKQKMQGAELAVWLASTVIVQNFTASFRITGEFTTDELVNAIERLKGKYPTLSMHVVPKPDGTTEFVSNPDLVIPLRIVERETASTWNEIQTTEMGVPFDMLTQPPIRIVWIRGQGVSELLLVCHHAFADGLAGFLVLRDILTLLGHPDLKFEKLPLYPPLNALIPNFSGKWRITFLAKLKAKLLKLLLSFRVVKLSSFSMATPEVNPKYFIQTWEWSKEQTAAFAARCKSEKATVHTALCTAFLRAFAEFHGDGWNRKIQNPVNLRNRLTAKVGEAFGLYINAVKFNVNCNPERDFWDISREIKKTLVQKSDDQSIFSELTDGCTLMDELVPVVTPGFIAKQLTKMDYDLSITNLGNLDFPSQFGSLEFENIFPSTIGKLDEVVVCVMTIRGKMTFSFTFTDVKYSVADIEKIKTKALKWINLSLQDQSDTIPIEGLA
ncbi:MAG: hypothetical protein KGO49_01395 [Gammaproteobacteria bacterium]|nr:hypothetical protein [Gammaproteobacteria bacterium]